MVRHPLAQLQHRGRALPQHSLQIGATAECGGDRWEAPLTCTHVPPTRLARRHRVHTPGSEHSAQMHGQARRVPREVVANPLRQRLQVPSGRVRLASQPCSGCSGAGGDGGAWGSGGVHRMQARHAGTGAGRAGGQVGHAVGDGVWRPAGPAAAHHGCQLAALEGSIQAGRAIEPAGALLAGAVAASVGSGEGTHQWV